MSDILGDHDQSRASKRPRDEAGLLFQNGQDLVLDRVSRAFPDLLVISTILVYMGSAPFGW